MERRQVFRVLISVSDKENIVDFARALDRLEIEIVSTGGTYKTISKKGIDVIPVEKVTNFPEMMGGRLKTLHPLIFGGILARDSDSKDAEKHNIDFFDMVVCNLYPFREAVSKGVDSESLIEQIDIGGPSLLRASAKNHARVIVVSDPADYDWIIDEIEAGGLTLLQRQDLALKALGIRLNTIPQFKKN
jgi:phosphoribosylaminoimidazolecarboxamide formyltransferase/IMP cyclohydrolase